MKRCGTEDFVVRYGDWVEVFDQDNQLMFSFKATSDLCRLMLTRFLVFKFGMEPETNYRIKRRKQ